MRGVCSSFQPKSHAKERNFSPPAPSKAGCWGFVTQAVIHALVSSRFRSSTLLLRVKGAESEVNNLPLSKQRGRGGRRRNCSPTVQWAAGGQPRVFSTGVYLAHSSDPAGSSRGREQTFGLSFLHMGERLERFVCFSDSSTLSHSNPRTAEGLRWNQWENRAASEQDRHPAHGTQNVPGISTQPIESGLSFWVFFRSYMVHLVLPVL